MKPKTLLPVLLLIVIANTVIGAFLPPYGIFMAPVVMILISVLANIFDNDLHVIIKTLVTYLFIGLNDVGVKLFAGGVHDSEGQGWVNMFFFIGIIPPFVCFAIGVFNNKNSTTIVKISAVTLFIVLIGIHLLLFGGLGYEEKL